MGAAQAPPPTKIKLTFEAAGKRLVWVQPKEAAAVAVERIPVTTAGFELTGKEIRSDALVHVLDEDTGNLAVRQVKDIGAEWKVLAKEFSLIGTVEVHVESGGKPVAAASVQLKDGKGTVREELLAPDSNGTLTFEAVAPGDLKFRVRYKVKGEEADPFVATFPASLKRAKAIPTFTIALDGDVATVGSAETEKAPKAPEKSEPKVAPRSAGSDLLNLFVTLAILGAVAYLTYRWFKQDPARMKAVLKRLGAEVPEPQTPQDPAAPPAAPAVPQPPPQILLDDAAPTPLGTAPVSQAAVPISSASGEPRLVRDNGQVLKIAEGAGELGREDGLPYALSGESTVSRRHVEIAFEAGTVKVRDLGSTNGTFVNGVRLDGEAELRPGDQVQFGSVRFRFER